MQKTLSTSADAEIILKLYELRTEAGLREARHWVMVKFWPATVDEFNVVLDDFGSQENRWLRQAVSYWEMAAALVLHGAVSADLFIDTNTEPFFILAKLAPILPGIHERRPSYLSKTLQLVETFAPAAACYEAMKIHTERIRASHSTEWLHASSAARR